MRFLHSLAVHGQYVARAEHRLAQACTGTSEKLYLQSTFSKLAFGMLASGGQGQGKIRMVVICQVILASGNHLGEVSGAAANQAICGALEFIVGF
jgi:hypothetical protein